MCVFALAADEQATQNISFGHRSEAWFTGPLIAPSGYTVKPGHVNVQPYQFVTVDTGVYSPHWGVVDKPNFYTLNLVVPSKVGIYNGFDFHVVPSASYNKTEGVGSFAFGDMPFGFSFQLLFSEFEDPWPAIKLTVRASVPSGKYQQLSESRLKTDVGGTGSWEPGVSLIFGKLWNTHGIHYLETRLSMNYRIETPVHVRGFNVYGGSADTRGIVYPGNVFTIDGAIEYNFTKRWAFACDAVYTHVNRTDFSGRAGTLSDGTPGTITGSSTEQFSLAPAIEYNLSRSYGFIGGVWFSFAGRNAPQFASGILSFDANF